MSVQKPVVLRARIRATYCLPAVPLDRRKRRSVLGSTSDRDKLRRRLKTRYEKTIVEEAVNPCDNVKGRKQRFIGSLLTD